MTMYFFSYKVDKARDLGGGGGGSPQTFVLTGGGGGGGIPDFLS